MIVPARRSPMRFNYQGAPGPKLYFFEYSIGATSDKSLPHPDRHHLVIGGPSASVMNLAATVSIIRLFSSA